MGRCLITSAVPATLSLSLARGVHSCAEFLTTSPRIALAVLGTAAVVTACGQGVGASSAAGGTGTVTTTQGPPVASQRCPWATASAAKRSHPRPWRPRSSLA